MTPSMQTRYYWEGNGVEIGVEDQYLHLIFCAQNGTIEAFWIPP